MGTNRYNFLLECLADLQASLEARGSRLLVLRGTPQEVLPRVFKVGPALGPRGCLLLLHLQASMPVCHSRATGVPPWMAVALVRPPFT